MNGKIERKKERKKERVHRKTLRNIRAKSKNINNNPVTRKRNKNNTNTPFKDADYNSGDGMLTSVWGPSLWHYLHIMSFNYPVKPTKQDIRNYKDFILQLQYVLPCGYCRINLSKNLKHLPLTNDRMKNRGSFSLYIYELHEHINTMLGKKSGLTYDDVRNRYEHFRSRCSKETRTNIKNKEKSNGKKKSIKKENGCTNPLYGKKSKCIIKIVPQETKCENFQMDSKCKCKIIQ